MSRIYELCADEAWTHCGEPLRRYWCFFGGILGLEPDLARLEAILETIIRNQQHRHEIKWGKISAQSRALYLELIDAFFNFLETHDVKYRQLFMDRKFVYLPKRGESETCPLDAQFKVYYQFLKHHFGLKYLPRPVADFDSVYFRLDEHSSAKHKKNLKKLAETLPQLLHRTDIQFHVSFVNSKKHRRLQMCDLIMGAAGSYGNQMHKKREPGQRGMSPKQKLRLEISKHVYERLKAIVMSQRGVRGFNWFESTGNDGDTENMFSHKIRIWKFIPFSHRVDKGWENDNLDSQGNYRGAAFLNRVDDPF